MSLVRAVPAQRGMALMLMLVVVGVAALGLLVNFLSRAAFKTESERKTAVALAQAKAALIGYAAGVALAGGSERPGDLPCPDNHPAGDPLEGTPSAPCSGNALGRLPWKKLGLPDLRDGSGERLWYAVSVNFKNSPRSGTLNSDTFGTLTVRGPDGAVINDGSGAGGAIAVVIAPGGALVRRDNVQQERSAANYNNPAHYLDCAGDAPACGIEDNRDFINGGANGFIQGETGGAGGNPVVNDRLIAVAYGDLMPLLEKRVAKEALLCLADYAAQGQNKGRYPWAAKLDGAAAPNYDDDSGARFGRLPDTFLRTVADSGGAMKNGWTTACNLNLGAWWNNWKQMAFFALADAHKPASPLANPACGVTGTCLAVTPLAGGANKQTVVLVAGKRLAGIAGGQPRTSNANKGDPANYLEDDNNPNAPPPAAADAYARQPAGASFNDSAAYCYTDGVTGLTKCWPE